MQIAPDTLRDVLSALTEAHAYIIHPASITPCATKRVATHRVPRHQFSAMDHQIRAALKTLDGLIRAETPCWRPASPSPHDRDFRARLTSRP